MKMSRDTQLILKCAYREVETLFHECGHALQHMLTKQEEGLVAGIRCRAALQFLLETYPSIFNQIAAPMNNAAIKKLAEGMQCMPISSALSLGCKTCKIMK